MLISLFKFGILKGRKRLRITVDNRTSALQPQYLASIQLASFVVISCYICFSQS